ncbi:MAG: tetratricopeptide repeat protein, partial [Stellaceae bacterium]
MLVSKITAVTASMRTARGFDALWIFVLTAACALALSGCASVGDKEAATVEKIAAAQAEVMHKEADASKSALERGDEAVAKSDNAAAAAFYRQAHSDDPSAPAPLLRLGQVDIALGQYTQAYEAYHL